MRSDHELAELIVVALLDQEYISGELTAQRVEQIIEETLKQYRTY
jgi:hypothetical protein